MTGESVMAGDGFYSAHSRPQHVAAEAGIPMLERAASEVPVSPGTTVGIGDFGCAGGRNEVEPMARAIDAVRARVPGTPVLVTHADLPANDWMSLFDLVELSPESYLHGRPDTYVVAAARSLYGPVCPDRSLTLAWTAITVHWLSEMPVVVPDTVYPNLTTGDARDALRRRSAEDWSAFLRERARELVPDGQVVVVGGSSDEHGTSGAEGLFRMVDAELTAMVDAGDLRPEERARIFYPTWNRTPAEFVDPLTSGPAAELFELVEWSAGAIDDADTHPQWVRDHDAGAFADAYLPFVRAVTEPSFFRWLDDDRTDESRRAVVEDFYGGLRDRIAADPDAATCRWHTVSLRIRRR